MATDDSDSEPLKRKRRSSLPKNQMRESYWSVNFLLMHLERSRPAKDTQNPVLTVKGQELNNLQLAVLALPGQDMPFVRETRSGADYVAPTLSSKNNQTHQISLLSFFCLIRE
jgi:hypothetical protein